MKTYGVRAVREARVRLNVGVERPSGDTGSRTGVGMRDEARGPEAERVTEVEAASPAARPES